jgi:PIN domain nuclease of toxin-antitoxin system
MAGAGSAVVLDASAVIALLLDEPGGTAVATLLRSNATRMATVNAAEVVDVLVRVNAVEEEDAFASVEELLTSVVEPVTASLELAMIAGGLRGRLFDRRTSRLSIADCFVLAIAEPGDRIATTDRTLAAASRDEGYDVVELG